MQRKSATEQHQQNEGQTPLRFVLLSQVSLIYQPSSSICCHIAIHVISGVCTLWSHVIDTRCCMPSTLILLAISTIVATAYQYIWHIVTFLYLT